MGSLLKTLLQPRLIAMTHCAASLLLVAVALLSFTSRGVGAVDSNLLRLERKIEGLEQEFDTLSQRSCKDGQKGKDGNCGNICSKDHYSTFQNNATKTGRAACCRVGEAVAASGACRKLSEPEFRSRLKGRLVKLRLDGKRHELFLRGFEGEIEGTILKCDNDCCCTNSKGVFDSSSARSGDDRTRIFEALKKCGLYVFISITIYPPRLGLGKNCLVYRVKGSVDTAGFKNKFNFVMANPSPYYKGTLCMLGQNC